MKNYSIEGLRGISIILIIIYHGLYRFREIYLPYNLTSFNWCRYFGEFGSIMFLLISSYFLYTIKPLDNGLIGYYKKKIIRLWPIYAISISITFLCTNIWILPGRTVSFIDYLFNLIFLNGFINIPYVDGAHWYLTVLITAIFWIGILRKFQVIHKEYIYYIILIIAFMLKIFKLGYLSKLICGDYIGIITIGIIIHKFILEKDKLKLINKILIIGILILGLSYTLFISLRTVFICIVCSIIIFFIQNKHIKFLENRYLLFIAKISYPIYLLHQNLIYLVEYHLFF